MTMEETPKKSTAEIVDELITYMYIWYDQDIIEWTQEAILEEVYREGSTMSWCFKRMQIIKN